MITATESVTKLNLLKGSRRENLIRLADVESLRFLNIGTAVAIVVDGGKDRYFERHDWNQGWVENTASVDRKTTLESRAIVEQNAKLIGNLWISEKSRIGGNVVVTGPDDEHLEGNLITLNIDKGEYVILLLSKKDSKEESDLKNRGVEIIDYYDERSKRRYKDQLS
ncbi:MAG: hypothetical protein ABSD68_04280 [Candidatus Micrarchaeales archaeon]|jgi:hypothetical protein